MPARRPVTLRSALHDFQMETTPAPEWHTGTLVTLSVNGQRVVVPAGSMVSTAVALAGVTTYRRSVTGEPRAPLCGMGICFECCVRINGLPHCRSCLILSESGMEVQTDE